MPGAGYIVLLCNKASEVLRDLEKSGVGWATASTRSIDRGPAGKLE